MSSDLRLAGAPLRVRAHARARTLRLKLDPRTGALVLTHPSRVSLRRALAWAREQEGWARAALDRRPQAVPIGAADVLPYRGEPHRIVHVGGTRSISASNGELRVGGPAEGADGRLLRWLKREAARLLDEDTARFAAKAGVTVTRVSVGDAVSRWGSCSASGAIRYSWRLVFAPDFVRAAIAAHEVAHRVHMNHGPAFHALVADLLGEDPKRAYAWLKTEGARLQSYGR